MNDDFGDEWANYTGDPSPFLHDIEFGGDVDSDESQKKPKKTRNKRGPRVGTTTTTEHLKFARIDEANGEVGKRAAGESPEGNIVVKFSNPEHRGMGSVEDSATMYLQRSSYSGSAWNEQRKHTQTEAIRRGQESTPKIRGSKKMIVR